MANIYHALYNGPDYNFLNMVPSTLGDIFCCVDTTFLNMAKHANYLD